VTAISLVIGGLLVVLMIGIAAYGWVTLPADARVPIHHGLGGYNNFVSKKAALITYSVAGVGLFAILAVLSEAVAAPDRGGTGTAVVVMLIALAVAAFVEWGAIAAARKNGGFRG
jgi:hypothetical protein